MARRRAATGVTRAAHVQALLWRAVVLLIGVTCGASAVAGASADAQPVGAGEALRQAAAQTERLPRAALIERAQLLQPARYADVQLAADGRHLSFRRRDAQSTGLYLRALDSGREQRLLVDSEGVQMQWADDGRRLWLADRVGLAVHEIGEAVPRRVFKWDAPRQQQFMGAAPQASRHALIRERVVVEGQGVYRYLRIDAHGETVLLHEGAQAMRELLLHANGTLAFSHGYEGPAFETVVRRHHAQGSEVLHRCVLIQRCRLLAHADAGSTLYLLAGDAQGLLVLQRWQQGESGLHLLHRDPDGLADASYALWLAEQQDWLALAYHPDRRRWFGRDRRIDAQLATLQARLPDANLSLSTDHGGKLWLVTADRSSVPEAQHFLYRPAEDTLQPVFAEATERMTPGLPLAPTLAFAYRASDGMRLHAYVTLPRGVAIAQAPLIALPHGGPYNRDRDGFDPLVQLLANRGNVVLQPNFRGSTGYGMAYTRAAGGAFGKGRVLQDIIEGLDVLLEADIGAHDRQALMGHSFGGYASLLGAVHHPQRFRVVVASAAPVDLAFSMRRMAEEGGSGLPADGPPAEVLLPQYGMPFADAGWHAQMRRESPLAQVDQLRVPVYLWAGAADDRVPLPEVVRLAADARAHGQSPVLLIDPDSGHSPTGRLPHEAVLWLYEVAASRHLDTALQPPSPPLQRFLDANLHPLAEPATR